MFVIDRFEGEWAIIETDERKTFNLPKSILPREAKEGDVITLTAGINRKETLKRQANARALLNDFFNE